MMLPSYFGMWNTDAEWTAFTLPQDGGYSMEETVYWTFLTGWVMYDRRGRQTGAVPAFPTVGVENIFERAFRYDREACAWLDREQFLEEIGAVKRRCEALLREALDRPLGLGTEWLSAAEEGCAAFSDCCAFCKRRLREPVIARLNRFTEDEYVWYLIRNWGKLYILQLSDFG